MSKKPKLTPWFPGDVKPARPGVYQRNYALPGAPESLGYAYWTGEFWRLRCSTTREAGEKYQSIRSQLVLPWRGLAEQP